jgi:hypothetical protein
MKKLMLVVILPLLVGLAFAGPNLSTVSDPNAIRKPADPNAPACVEVPVPPVPVTDAPPPFGTVVQQWTLSMSGSYAGAGITWRRDSGRFYLMAQGRQVWSVDPVNPSGTARMENWILPNMGSGTVDIPWGLAWDNDSSCFWISNIVDGNIYGGCYYTRIRKSPVGDTWRWVNTNPGDTWLVGNGSMGGAGNMYWMGGNEKWFDRGIFACAPVSSGAYNYVWRFDPYTKTSLGNVANGASVSERGCALVPWDSLYILTTGWNQNQHVKRDTTGYALQTTTATVYGPADNAVWVPQVIGPDDTVFMYTICSDPSNTLQKISVGLLWNQLPSINPFNVRPLSILAPSGTVDSGQSIIPRLVIRNMSNEAANGVNAYFTIDDGQPSPYSDSVIGLNMPPRTTETIPYGGWIPRGRDSMSVTAWTYWQGDSFPKDDTIRNRFLVRVKDIAVTQILVPAPDTTVDSGVVFSPQCRVWNYGNVSLNFDVRFRIGAYQATRNLNLIAGGATVVTAPTPYTALPGIWACQVFAVVTGDLHPENNIMVDTFTVRGTITTDVDARAVLAPTGVVDTLTTIIPKGKFGNNGVDAATFWAFFSIRNPGGAEIYAESSQAMINAGEETEIEYPAILLTILGNYTAVCSTAMPGDQNSTNDVKKAAFRVVDKVTGDIGVTQIVRPPNFVYPDSSFIPQAKWMNYGAEPATISAYFFIHNKYGVRMYSQSQADVPLNAGEEITLDFPSFNVGNDTGRWYARCSTAAGDTNFANDTLDKFFTVGVTSYPQGWFEVAAVPMTPSGKAVKDGAWLAFDASKGAIFGAKGNKQPDFYSFDLATGWATMAPIPPGIEGKGTSKGGAACANGNGKLYATKGNNTVGFYEYDAAGNMWYQRKDVPLGVSGKKVKGGTGLAWGTKAGTGYAYVLKGYKNEFYKYNPLDSTWTTLTPAPVGANQKWDKGSWIVADNSGKMLYAHKAKYHEFYSYDTEMDSWSSAKTAMPIPGSAGSKKSKDGGSAAWFEGNIYAFKGGNTVEFWRYTPVGDSWREKEQIPLIGSTGKKKKIKAGAALAGYPGTALFGFKGNKSLEFWRYVPAATVAAPANREGVMAGVQPGLIGDLRISPNPLAGGFATVRYSLPKAGLATLRIYDVTGRTVLSQTMVAGRTGTAGLDLRKLNAGVYLVKVATEGFSTTQKLVVQH